MKNNGICPIEKRNVVTDLIYKDFLFVDLCTKPYEKDVVSNFLQWHGHLISQAIKTGLPQIQIKFPFKWRKLKNKLRQLGYHNGLYFVEKKLDGLHLLHGDIIKIGDASQIKQRLIEQQRIHFQFNPLFFDDPEKFDFNLYLDDLQRKIEMKKGIIYGLYVRKKMAGFIGLEIDDASVYINELFVEEKYRREGFGKTLMQAGFCYATKTSCENIWTTLAAQNNGGLKFYKSCGFNEIAQLDFLLLNNKQDTVI